MKAVGSTRGLGLMLGPHQRLKRFPEISIASFRDPPAYTVFLPLLVHCSMGGSFHMAKLVTRSSRRNSLIDVTDSCFLAFYVLQKYTIIHYETDDQINCFTNPERANNLCWLRNFGVAQEMFLELTAG